MTIIADTVSFSQTIQLLIPRQATEQRIVIDIPTPGIAIGLMGTSSAQQVFPIRSDDTPFYMTLLPLEELWMNSLETTGEISYITSYIDPLGE